MVQTMDEEVIINPRISYGLSNSSQWNCNCTERMDYWIARKKKEKHRSISTLHPSIAVHRARLNSWRGLDLSSIGGLASPVARWGVPSYNEHASIPRLCHAHSHTSGCGPDALSIMSCSQPYMSESLLLFTSHTVPLALPSAKTARKRENEKD